ncbi:hypothetical protein HZH66_004156 [Vespula vulgaris]|uniref:Uncharacterized protein n=1 Tax=Vespula vulgaris TaxID=7454 RepID=A0A834KER0_VESVU|nr:hypothetical protein HZH66_004156 [Vespula vulgaris]
MIRDYGVNSFAKDKDKSKKRFARCKMKKKKKKKKKRKELLALTTDVARATSKRSHGFVLHPISAFLQRQAPCF